MMAAAGTQIPRGVHRTDSAALALEIAKAVAKPGDRLKRISTS